MTMQGRLAAYTDIYEAIRDVIMDLGGFKQVGHLLKPEKAPDEAAAWLKDALNPDRREKLDPEQLMLILRKGREVSSHAAMTYINLDCGYSTPQPIESEDELAELLRQRNELAKAQIAADARIERVLAEVRQVRNKPRKAA